MQGKKTAIALGCFDGLHRGHMAVIAAAQKQKSRGLTPMALCFLRHPKETLMGHSPSLLFTHEQLIGYFSELGISPLSVDFQDICSMTAREFVEDFLIKEHNCAFVSCGFNFHFGKNAEGNASLLRELCSEFNIELEIVEPVLEEGREISSSRARSCVREGDMAAARRLLGRPFSLKFPVKDGFRRGRLIGFPTINQSLPEDFCVPAHGVYASNTIYNGKIYPSVTNIGSRPTVEGRSINAETHILGFSGELYGETVTVELLRHTRPEQKFDSLESLAERIKEDVRERLAMKREIILASQSPRRAELLQRAGFAFSVCPAQGEEVIDPSQGAEEICKSLAEQKAREVFARSDKESIILSADTIVVYEQKILGKPHDRAEAAEMLRQLSGRTHKVYTGVCICNREKFISFTEATAVEFYPLSEEEIEAYLDTGEAFDKAGAYGIQGFGCTLVKGIVGDYYNVMGLPIAAVARKIKTEFWGE